MSFTYPPTLYSQMEDDASNCNKEEDLSDLPSFARIVEFSRGAISSLSGTSYEHVVQYLSVDQSLNVLFIMQPLHLVYTLDWFSNVTTRSRIRARGVSAQEYTRALILHRSVAAAERAVLSNERPSFVAAPTRSRVVRSRHGNIICVTRGRGPTNHPPAAPLVGIELNPGPSATGVSIVGLNKVELLRRLWDYSVTASFNRMRHIHVSFGQCEDPPAEAVLAYIDYYSGRCIKLNLSGDYVEPGGYDRDYGEHAVARVVAAMRAASAAASPPAAPLVGIELNPGPGSSATRPANYGPQTAADHEAACRARGVELAGVFFIAPSGRMTWRGIVPVRLMLMSMDPNQFKPAGADLAALRSGKQITQTIGVTKAQLDDLVSRKLKSAIEVAVARGGIPLIHLQSTFTEEYVMTFALDPPAPPLVGIEVNPGPGKSALGQLSARKTTMFVEGPQSMQDHTDECTNHGRVLAGIFSVSWSGRLTWRGSVTWQCLLDFIQMKPADFKPTANELKLMRKMKKGITSTIGVTPDHLSILLEHQMSRVIAETKRKRSNAQTPAICAIAYEEEYVMTF